MLKELDLIFKYCNSEILNRPDRVTHLAEHWASISKVVGLVPTVVRHIFELARCGYELQKGHFHMSI